MSDMQQTERQEITDPQTGRRVIKWTDSSAKDQHLYFTSQSVTADGQYLLFISERSGAPNLHVIDRGSGTIRQLTHADALLRAYCYPQGATHGFSKATPYLDADRQHAYWVEDDVAWRIGLHPGAAPEKLAELPRGWYTGFTHLSPDGRTFCVPCTDPRAFSETDATQADQAQKVPWRMIKQGLKTRLCMIDTERGVIHDQVELPFWVTHVQFDPGRSGRVVFNSEGGVGATGDRSFPYWGRIWRLTPEGHWSRLYDQSEHEIINHENWMPQGDAIVYHGRQGERQFIAARTWEGDLVFHHETQIQVSHAISSPHPSRFTVDSRDGFVYLYDLSADASNAVTPLCAHGTSFKDQDAHSHPIVTPMAEGVVFTSDHTGTCNVYEVVTK